MFGKRRKKKKDNGKPQSAVSERPVFTGEDLIDFQHVFFTYDDLPEEEGDGPADPGEDRADVHMAISDLSLTIHRGDCLAVLGHNGSGKSTLAKLCNGILAPDQGDVISFGINTRGEDELLELRQHVGMVFQNPDNQLIASVVEEDVAFGPENLGVPPEEIRERVDRALEVVGMTKYRLHSPNKLSGGQKQRVAIAGILAMDPECIIFDESTAMLDPSRRREVMETIHRLHDEFGKTVVFITHYMEEAATADRVVVMDGGKIIHDGTPYEVFSDIEGLRSVGLDVPQVTEFAAMLREDGWNLSDKILTADECANAVAAALEVV